jgi:hypothetical protein
MPKMIESFRQRKLANLPVAPVRLSVMCDVALLPVFPKMLDRDAGRVALGQNRAECLIGARAHVDERAEQVEGEKLRRQGAFAGFERGQK